ncbi:Fc.00g114840.m01.CDS01 [Cosmosporella sp. VM-42]
MGNMIQKPAPDPSIRKLTDLSREIEGNTLRLAHGLSTNGLEAPSFDAGGLADFPLADIDEETLEARNKLISLTRELHHHVLGPREGLKTLAWDTVSYIPLTAISEFKIAEAVPRSGSISFQDLATEVHKSAGIDLAALDLRRLLRLAICNRLFCEPEPGFVAHNRTSLLLLEDENLASWVGMFTVDFGSPIAHTVEAMKKWPASQEPNETGINAAFNHDLSLFDHLKADEARAKRYELSMRSQTAREGFNVSHTVGSYPWAKLGEATVVDMGGNQGFVSIALAQAYSSLSFVVQDLPALRTSETIGKVPFDLTPRVTLTAHDIFEPQTVVAEAYLFRHVFHAFSDRYAVKILRALIPALRPGARIIINDMVLPTPGSVSEFEEKGVRTLDVLVLAVCNSREREVEDWKFIFEQSDAGFKWKGAWKSSGVPWIFLVGRESCHTTRALRDVGGNIISPDAGDAAASFSTTNAEIVPITMAYFTSFVMALDPNSFKASGAPNWQPWGDGTGQKLRLQTNATEMEAVPEDQQTKCAGWKGISDIMEV